jgi:glutathione S-transferase
MAGRNTHHGWSSTALCQQDIVEEHAMLKLFHCPQSCSLAPLIALEEAGAQFETVIVNLFEGAQLSGEYRAVNPKGKVPALATERGVLTENPAILAFVAMSYPEAKLAPLNDAFEFARMQGFNGYLASTFQPSAWPIGRPDRFSDDPAVQAALAPKALANVRANMALIEHSLFVGPWAMGENYSVADPYIFFFFIGVAERLKLDTSEFPRLLAHADRMRDRRAVARAMAVGLGPD